MQMYLYKGIQGGDRDGAFDNQIIVHELTHGLSNRLVGNAFGLTNQQGGGMGEGWSDFYSVSILSEYPETKTAAGSTAQDPDKLNPRPGWTSGNGRNYDNYFYGNRMFPYTTNLEYNPLTFADTDPYQYNTAESATAVPESPRCLSNLGAQVHNLGTSGQQCCGTHAHT